MAQTIHDIRRREHVNDDPNAERLYPEDIDAREIEEDIGHTRAAMDDTISELFERLAPKNLLSDVLGIVRESIRSRRSRKRRKLRRDYEDFDYEHDDEPGIARRAATAAGRQVVETVKNHPLPAALITAGIVWMATEPDRETRAVKRRLKRLERDLEMERPIGGYRAVYGRVEGDYGGETGMRGPKHSHGVKERVKEGAEHARERISETAHSLSERAGEAVGAVREGASHAAEKAGEWTEHTRERLHDAGEYISDRASDVGASVREGYHKTRDVYERAMDQYPLAIAIGALGIGVLAGLVLPRTRAEDKYLGEASDELKERGREAGREAMERGSDVAEHAVAAAASEVSHEMGGDSDENENEPARQEGERFRGTEI